MVVPQQSQVSSEVKDTTNETKVVAKIEPKPEPSQNVGPKVSSLSLSSIRIKKELEAQLKPEQKHHDELPVEPFTETEMLEQWLKYAQKLGNKGYKILESLMLINDPVLEGTTIIHELPNESSKIDFEGEKHDLLGYLRGKLHNHTINLEIRLNETIETKKAFTAEEKYQLMRDINPALDVLRKLFDLDV
ncbi:DNA polymerase III subunit gamma/tau [Flavobacterium oreochromis]|uniref:DNA polymerase III subunit gamma/tau n=1 Tax=Flavobacterium oreochromis TaxID=2906078 RepID=UPI003858CB5D